MKRPCVDILASKPNGTLYVGVTSKLIHRVWQHRNEELEGFTKRYSVHLLVYYEFHADMRTAIWREKCIKHWHRQWKVELIERTNPRWVDLYPALVPGVGPPLSRG